MCGRWHARLEETIYWTMRSSSRHLLPRRNAQCPSPRLRRSDHSTCLRDAIEHGDRQVRRDDELVEKL